MSIIDLSLERGLDSISSKVCIIGSGPAGAIVAGHLVKAGIDITLLEAGNHIPDYDLGNIANSDEFIDNGQIRFGQSRQLGGSSNLWAGRTHPLERIDFEKRSWVPNSGWPINFEKMLPFYIQASKILNLPDYQYFTRQGVFESEENIFSAALNKASGLEQKIFQWAEKPFNCADYLKSLLTQFSHLRVVLNAPVSQLIENGEGSKVQEALVYKKDGKALKIKADYFVLAAGGIETPSILLNSTHVKPRGIGNEHDVVGRYFSTHPKADMAAIILNRGVNTFSPIFTDHQLGTGRMRAGIGVSRELQKRLELLNHYVQLSPVSEYKSNKIFESLKKTKVFNSSLIDSSLLIKGYLPGLGKIAYEVVGRIAKLQPRAKTFILRGFLDQYPDRNNRIRLSSEKKSDGTLKAEIDWRFSENDRSSVLRFFNHLNQILTEKEIGKVEYSQLERSHDWPIIGVHSHFMGATRMGVKRQTSVTDENALVHGTENLYIAGPSLFPTYGFANPFLTIVALSLRLATHLRSSIKTNRQL